MDLLGALLLFALVALVVYAIVGAKGAQRKLLSLLHILMFMTVGFGTGYGLGLFGQNHEVGLQTGASLTYLLGLVGALGRIRENRRAKATF